MKNKENFFSFANKLFWTLIIIIVVFSILRFNSGLFKTEDLAKEIIRNDSLSKIDWEDGIVENDSAAIKIDWDNIENDTITKKKDTINKEPKFKSSNWNWRDFNGKEHKISFYFPSNAIQLAEENRKKYTNYDPLYENDRLLLVDLIKKMKNEIKQSNLNYMEAIEYVCSSIQFIPYTLILNSTGIEYPPNSGRFLKCPCQTSFGFYINNCNSKIENGCCNDVNPFGVYSPFEFAYKKTGDCDTRALLAFTILKEMGFDVAVMVSEKKGHSVLGVYLPNMAGYSVGKNLNNKKYVLWELTNPDWRLGYPVEGNDWITALE
jgi:hypothetical protein